MSKTQHFLLDMMKMMAGRILMQKVLAKAKPLPGLLRIRS